MEPLNLTLTLNPEGSLTAAWEAIPGAERYHALLRQAGEKVAIYNEENLTATRHTSKSGLEAGRQYEATVTAYGGGTSLASQGCRLLIPWDFYESSVLPVPANVRAAADATSVTVSYEAVEGAACYDILFDGTSHAVTATSHRFTGLPPGTSHSYAVRARNESCTGSYSPVQTIDTPFIYLGAPTGVTQRAGVNAVTLGWEPVEGAAGYDLLFGGTRYGVVAPNKTVTGLAPGTSYPFQIRARNGIHTGAYTEEAQALTLPGPPQSVSATAGNTWVSVKWSEVEGSQGYLLEFNGEVLPLSEQSTGLYLEKLTPQTNYTYRVATKNAAGTGPYSPLKTAATTNRTINPPGGYWKTVTSDSATLYWDPVREATGYDVWFEDKVYSTTATSQTVTGLEAGTTYHYRIRSKSGSLLGEYFPELAVTTAPNPPQWIVAVSTETTVTLFWKEVEGATRYSLLFDGKTYLIAAPLDYFIVTDLMPGSPHTYRIASQNRDGTGTYSPERTIATKGGVPGTLPNLRTESTDTTVTVSWDEVSGATGYDLLFDGRVYSVEEPSCRVEGLVPNTPYRYQVRTRNDQEASAYGPERTIRTAPAAPSAPAAVPGRDAVTVSWDEVSGATGYDLLFDGVLYPVEGTAHTVTGLAPGSAHTYAVRSRHEDGAGSYSAPSTVETLPNPPAVPAAVTAAVTETTATISWEPVSGATEYDVDWREALYRMKTTSGTFQGLTPDTAYRYRVRARNAGGSGEFTPFQTLRTLESLPQAPSHVTAQPGPDYAVVRWEAVSGATGYDLLFGNDIYPVEGLFFMVKELKPETEYTYRVRAKNGRGAGPYSPLSQVTTLVLPPGPPEQITATATWNSFTVEWSPVEGAAGYQIRVFGGVYDVAATRVTFPEQPSGEEITYQVRSVNAGGSGPYSAPGTIRTLGPGKPRDLRAEATMDSVTISFLPVEGAEGYDILFDGKLHHVEAARAETETSIIVFK